MNRWAGCAALALAFVLLPAWSSTARASMVLELQSGSDDFVIPDGGGLDQSSTAGTIVYVGTVGDYSLNITTGYSNSPGNSSGGLLQIQDMSAADTIGGTTLTVTLQDTDFTQPPSTSLELQSAAGLTVTKSANGDSVTFQSYADPGNAQGGTTVTTGLQSFPLPTISTTTSYNNTATPVGFTGSGSYSMMNVTTVTLSANGQLNLSGTSTVVPEPASLGILAAAGVGLTLMRRRKAYV